MIHYTAADICRAINSLDRNRLYGYVSPKNPGEIKICHVQLPEGPITIRRRDYVGGTWKREESISSQMLWRLANAINTRIPINVDRVFGGSYNTRSVLEALLAHTPEIYTCSPGRQEDIGGHVSIKPGHKHIIWVPENPHQAGQIVKMELGKDCVISEIPSYNMMYDVVPTRINPEIDIEIQRRHSQIQVALAEIAKALNMRTWLAVEDHGIIYNGKCITEYPFIIKDLSSEPVISEFPKAIHTAKHIDCMYFNGGLPFAFEVEHTTGVTSGLNRMLTFKNSASYLNTQYVIVAPDDDRQDVLTKCSNEQFEDLHPLFFSYSKVEELYSFVSRYSGSLKGIKKDFLLTFMETAG